MVASRRELRLRSGGLTRSAGWCASFRRWPHPGFRSGWEHASQRFPFQIRVLSTQFSRPNGRRHSRGDHCGAGARAQTVTVVTPNAIVTGLDLAGALRSGRRRCEDRGVPRFQIAPKQRPECRFFSGSCPLRAQRRTLAPRPWRPDLGAQTLAPRLWRRVIGTAAP